MKYEITVKRYISVLKEQTETNIDEIKKPRQRKQTAPKTKGKATIKKVGAEKQTVNTVNNEAHKIKQSKRSLDATAKSIKKADKTVKTAKNTVKTTASTTKKTAEVAKRTKQTVQATVRVTIKTVKVAAKVLVEAGKAVVAGVKSIGAVIAVGGVPAIVIIIIATLLLEEDVDIRYIQEFLGHSSITTTQIYTHVSLNAQKKMLQKKHPRNKLKINSVTHKSDS